LPTFSEQLQNQEQLQNLLKETMKENKTLQNKNAKLESKYVELFKEHKLLKKDHTTFITFLAQYFSRNQNSEEPQPIFQEIAIGLYELAEL
jgi:predicted nuclease with TOPRIM domain